MNHLKYLRMLNETPIAYDDKTILKIGTKDSITKTKWGPAPPKNIGIDDLQDWVNDMIKNGVMDFHTLGKGASKTCKYNDGKKTVFKYNYNTKTYGNQIAFEVKIYEKHFAKYSDIIPKFYMWGKHWVIQEYLESTNDNTKLFEKVTNIPWYVWNNSLSGLQDCQESWNLRHHPKDTVKSFIKTEVSVRYRDNVEKILENKNLMTIIEFCFKTKARIFDMHEANLAVTKDRKTIKVIDFGI